MYHFKPFIFDKWLFTKKYAEQFDKYMQAQVNVNDFSGVVIISKNGKTIYKKPFGIADREWGIKNSIETKFEIGSLTKQFTAVSILKLVEQNKLDLTDRLTKYFLQYPKRDSITKASKIKAMKKPG